ncbi:hypothetical protein DDB_G0287075 [Dictyostelium discoideum AX4]|uniref:Transmembrane protein n=1 Tax=Dictyostelium discoideum TaxID=44689 RepID=Q54KV7_DICDI|nr:hypothetical protein DDB_G0287075 [Dictyostelium discoideum AX4]EAL63902.1 hypothetical protein DDB_G0287075 [Dictyostelium discoideum AX4]|eukprot:XP_637413.1 hypothetical protein DDB_G0287075 [Dictyostelium discoideum AX4]
MDNFDFVSGFGASSGSGSGSGGISTISSTGGTGQSSGTVTSTTSTPTPSFTSTTSTISSTTTISTTTTGSSEHSGSSYSGSVISSFITSMITSASESLSGSVSGSSYSDSSSYSGSSYSGSSYSGSGSISGGSSSTSPSSSSSSSPSTGSSSDDGLCYDWITVWGYKIYDPFLVPLCLWALYIGVSRFKLFKKYNCNYLYSVTFLMYGIMMTFAMLADSLSSNFYLKLRDFVSVADVDLTSTVGTFFLYCGLADVGIINPKETKTKIILLFNSIILLISWVYGLYYSSDPRVWALVLYEAVVAVSCGVYLILQIIYLAKRKNLKSIFWLLFAGLVGGVGLSITLFSSKWCAHFGAHFSSSYAWFFLSDCAMLLISHYVTVSRGSKSPSSQSFYNKQPLLSKLNNDTVNKSTIIIPSAYKSPVVQSYFISVPQQVQPQQYRFVPQQPQPVFYANQIQQQQQQDKPLSYIVKKH